MLRGQPKIDVLQIGRYCGLNPDKFHRSWTVELQWKRKPVDGTSRR